MDSLIRLLLRFLLVPLGVIAGMIATMVVVMVGYWRIGELLEGAAHSDAFVLFDSLAAASFALMAVVLAMWAVAAIGILFAEMFAIRTWIFHVGNGAVSSLVSSAVFSPYPDVPVPFDDGTLYVVGAGLAGGLAYWLVAGWTSGFWKPMGGAPAAPAFIARPSVPSSPFSGTPAAGGNVCPAGPVAPSAPARPAEPVASAAASGVPPLPPLPPRG